MERPAPLHVAAAQMAPALLELDTNAQKHLELIAEARARGADVLVFPELSLTGYLVGERGYDVGIALSNPLSNPLLRQLAEAAGAMTVVVGFVEEGFGAQFFNAAAVLSRGELVAVHRKLNLANYGDMQEAKFFAQGRFIEPFPLPPPFTGAILVCSDMWNPALVHIAALHGATVLLVPTNSSLDLASGDVSKPERWELVLRFYSTLYGLPIVFCNRTGREEGHLFWGGSCIVDAFGSVLTEAAGDGEELLFAALDYAAVRKARFLLPTVRDSNLALIHREIERLVRQVGVPSITRPT